MAYINVSDCSIRVTALLNKVFRSFIAKVKYWVEGTCPPGSTPDTETFWQGNVSTKENEHKAAPTESVVPSETQAFLDKTASPLIH